ncbi:MAG: phosphatidate cytidylyltransferase [Oscillospiraceae bacterium]|nr:phosphatidate cytidylyltransferase [Oscillospiraceae bacterium]
MKNRIIYAVLLFAVLLVCVFLSPVTRLLFVAVAGCLCAYEYSHQMEKLNMHCSLAVMIGYLAVHTLLVLFEAGLTWYCACFVLAVYAAMLSGILRKKVSGNGALDTTAGLAYPCMLFAVVIVISVSDIWLETFALGCISAWLCDTGAFLGGSRFGRHKLAPAISPNKSVEGALFGALAGTLGGALVFLIGLLLKETPWIGAMYSPVPLWACVMIGFLASTMGQLGDLAESLLKRMIGVKDFSNLIPGHGGMFDRADSLLFSLPTAYLCLRLIAVQ